MSKPKVEIYCGDTELYKGEYNYEVYKRAEMYAMGTGNVVRILTESGKLRCEIVPKTYLEGEV